MNRSGYALLATVTLSFAVAAGILAVVGGILGQGLAAGASLLCAGVLGIPGIYFLGHERRLRARDLALIHAARFAQSRTPLDLDDLATELRVPRADAERILQTAIREGHARGTFDREGRFIPSETGPSEREDG